MRLDQVLEEFEYTVSGGSDYLWKCYGPNARFLDMGKAGVGGCIVFDSESQYVYEVQVWRDDDQYRWIDEHYVSAYKKEASERGIDPKIAYDDVGYIDIDNENEMLHTIYKVRQGTMPPRPQKESEEDGIVDVDLPEDVLLKLAMDAHKQNITLNEHVINILRVEIERVNWLENLRLEEARKVLKIDAEKQWGEILEEATQRINKEYRDFHY